jgi:hypothetical protein
VETCANLCPTYTEIARRFGIGVTGIGYSVEKGEIIARENDYQLNKFLKILRASCLRYK